MVARFKEFGVVGVVPGIFVRDLFFLWGWRERRGRERYIMPEIMHSYCSHMGTPLRSCARAMISARLWVAAILVALGEMVDAGVGIVDVESWVIGKGDLYGGFSVHSIAGWVISRSTLPIS